MKQIKLAVILLALMCININAQIFFDCSRVYAVRKSTLNNPTTYSDSWGDIASNKEPNSDRASVDRAVWKMTIPSNINRGRHVTSVQMGYVNAQNTTDEIFNVDLVDNYYTTSDYAERWGITESAVSKNAGFGYLSTTLKTITLSNTNTMVDAINKAIDNGQSEVYFSIRWAAESLRTIPIAYFSSISITCESELWTQHTIKNSPEGGIVVVNNEDKPSGYVVKQAIGTNVSLAAKSSQDYNGNTYVWNSGSTARSQWVKDFPSGTSTPPTQEISYTTSSQDRVGNCTAQLRRLYYVPVAANITSGYMTVNSINKNLPGSAGIIDQNSASVYVPDQSGGSSLWATFEKWSDNSTDNPRTVQHSNSGLTANFILKATNEYRNMQFNSTIGDHITITWNEHPDPNVGSYKIYRKEPGNANVFCIGRVYRGSATHSFSDINYLVSQNNGPNSRVRYDVRAVYSGQLPDGTNYTTESDEDMQLAFGSFIPDPNKIANDKNDTKISAAIPTAYALGNYPNPFNPTTVIKYDLPEAGQVSLKVYNLLSQEVASLVEGSQSAGTHQVSFNAHNLPTGIYIARLQAGNKVMSVKLQLIK